MTARRAEHLMVVGLDGSPGSAAALRWAAARTGRFGPVQAVAAWQYPWWSLTPLAPGAAALPPPSADFHAEARTVVDQLMEREGPMEHVDPVTIHGPAGQVLVGVADRASLLVVGTRGHGPMAAGVLGSVSLYCVNHATAPVVVIPQDALADDRFHRVVVGFDGSPHALSALRWAVANTPADTRVELLCCRRDWDSHGPGHGHGEPSANPEAVVEAAVELARELSPDAAGRVVGRCEDGDPRQLLALAAADADLLVLGARGRGGVAHLLVGSVATALVHQPVIPTVVLH